MRVLLVHNYYGSSAPSGENKVFEAEKAMFEKYGETVEVFVRHSDEIRLAVGGWWLVVGIKKIYNLIKGALCTIGNPFAAWALAKKIREFKPDVVHFHNQFPLISPLAIRAAHKSGAKVVMTLHNYRTVCAAGVPTRDGHVCTECFREKEAGKGNEELDKETFLCSPSPSVSTCSVRPALRHRCYRVSLLATIPLAINIWLYRKCWARWVDRFIVLSEFQKNRMVECGLPLDKIVVKGNFVAIHRTKIFPSTQRSGVVFVGRLSAEKGVRTLLEAWRLLRNGNKALTESHRLTLIGDGDCRIEYEGMAEGLDVEFTGKLDHESVIEKLSMAKLLVLPSEWWETFGLVVVEAAICGTPAVVSDVGALPSIVDSEVGGVCPMGDAQGLAEMLARTLARSDYDDVCVKARKRAVERYSEASNYRQLIEVYGVAKSLHAVEGNKDRFLRNWVSPLL